MAPTAAGDDTDGGVLVHGFWGTPTATIDWCEKNYEISSFIAEFWNTISNLSMIVPPACGSYFAWKYALGLRFALCHFLLFVIGLGSWSFHMTLLYEMQLFDELPMLYGSCVLVYCLVELLFPELDRRRIVTAGLFCYALVVTVVYLVVKEPIFHQVAYGILVALIFFLNVYLARTRKCDLRLFVASAAMYLLGFVLWNIDNRFCSPISSVRSGLSPFVSGLTQLHAWWHVMAGYASYLHIVFWQVLARFSTFLSNCYSAVTGNTAFVLILMFTCISNRQQGQLQNHEKCSGWSHLGCSYRLEAPNPQEIGIFEERIFAAPELSVLANLDELH